MIDWQRVNDLHEDVGAAEFAPLLELFIDEMETVLARITTDNSATLSDDLHFIRGSALNIGFEALTKQCRELELQAQPITLEQLDQLRACYAQSKALLTRELPLHVKRSAKESHRMRG